MCYIIPSNIGIILPSFFHVVNFDEDGNFTSIIDKFKKQIPEIKDETKILIKSIQESVDFANKEGMKFDFSDNFVGEMEISEQSLKDFLKTWDGSGDLLDEYSKSLSSASSSASKFGAALKSAFSNMAIMAAVTIGVELLSAAIDQAVVTFINQHIIPER